jgi:hypothetical protein
MKEGRGEKIERERLLCAENILVIHGIEENFLYLSAWNRLTGLSIG